jgi:hypothetical protein
MNALVLLAEALDGWIAGSSLAMTVLFLFCWNGIA